jgi:hypothetical protein
MATKHSQTSPYSLTPITDYYLDVWVPNISLQPKTSDISIVLDPKYDRRPDKLSFERYGTEELYWVFAARNKDILIDPINDFRAGITIFIPTEL